ncbi:MAG: diacylglycerol kinase family protein [bacterium]
MIAIIANPKAGSAKLAEKKNRILNQVASRINATIFGLDSKDKPAFQQIAQSLSNEAEIVIVAGGDGTFSDVLNANLNPNVILAYLPLGSGNALRFGLDLPTSLNKWIAQYQQKRIKELDVILYNDTYRCFFSGIGFEAQIMLDRKRMRDKGFDGIIAYGIPITKGILTAYPRFDAECDVDGIPHTVSNILTISLNKHPYYGYGIKANPYAVWDDGYVHVRPITESPISLTWRLPYSFIKALRPQTYFKGKSVTIHTQAPFPVQCDGEIMPATNAASFTIIPKNVKVIM